ncbi:ABC transporter permease subunit [Blastococcus haudaquaticus]|uniref:ABC-2 family transporter protein n=1 Tax=Blastococcus haudaquaticus TaxID=1938745 RepID=A0A286H987_9ACTN|nr:ABC transporter permease subunit [Blastococcus haudaquaticus]SOE03814.1 ABC-2 family transporter protein [Blastococcus haudaquaticus]
MTADDTPSTTAAEEALPMTDTITLAPPTAPGRPGLRRTVPSLPGLTGIEIRKSLSTRSGKALAVATVLLAPVATAVVAAASTEPLTAVDGPIAIMGLLTGYLLVSLGVLSTAGEWSHRTVQTTYLLVPHRGRVLAAKAVAVALMGALLGLVSTALTSGVLALMESGVSWDGAPRAIGAAVLAGAAFAVIGAGVGAALANSAAALTGLYLVLLGVMPIVSTFEPEVANAIDPANAVINLGQGAEQAQSAVNLGVWLVVASVAGWIVTHRRAVQ